MHIEGKYNYHEIFTPTLLEIKNEKGEAFLFQPPKENNRFFDSVLLDMPNSESVIKYNLTTMDMSNQEDIFSENTGITINYLVHPGMRAIIVPPNAIEIPQILLNQGVSQGIQLFFEKLSQKMQYRLLVGITPETAARFNQKVVKILRNIGYYIGPPSDKSNIYFGEHQSTYTGRGISEIGIQPEYMLSPTI